VPVSPTQDVTEAVFWDERIMVDQGEMKYASTGEFKGQVPSDCATPDEQYPLCAEFRNTTTAPNKIAPIEPLEPERHQTACHPIFVQGVVPPNPIILDAEERRPA